MTAEQIAANPPIQVRTERFSTAGTATKPKVALAYRSHRALLFRGSYNQSFRAPNLVQTNAGASQSRDRH